MTEHTPGPWVLKNQTEVDERFLAVRGADGTNIVDWGDRGANKTCVANARLIASAPELLEALDDLLGFARSIRSTRSEICAERDLFIRKGVSAIAKARGQE